MTTTNRTTPLRQVIVFFRQHDSISLMTEADRYKKSPFQRNSETETANTASDYAGYLKIHMKVPQTKNTLNNTKKNYSLILLALTVHVLFNDACSS
jgi:hypothetical protein